MTTTQSEFLQTHAVDGKLTPRTGGVALGAAAGRYRRCHEGHRRRPPASTAIEATTTDQTHAVNGESNDKGAAATLAIEHDAGNTVIIAKDGKHTIGYPTRRTPASSSCEPGPGSREMRLLPEMPAEATIPSGAPYAFGRGTRS